MARILAAIILLYATNVQSADNFKTDKAECDEWGKAFYLVAEWRESMTKSEAYDKVMGSRMETDDDETTVNMLKIIYLVFDSKETSEKWKSSAAATCLKQRGYTGA